jgi:methionyl aminopeptidase
MVKDADTIARMRVAGRIAADALVEVGTHVAPGVSTDELDRVGHEFLTAHGAYPSTLGYKNFPKSLCTSVNEVICHGIPDSRPLEDGDIVKVDITAFIGGVHGDTCATFFAGTPREDVRLLGERTREAMLRGIQAVRPGRPISVIGRVIESYAKRFGYGVVRDYTGHGVGPSFHTEPTILHYDNPRATTVLEPGMTFTVEPMLTLGGYDWYMWDDDWTVLTKDGSMAAQWEHSLVVTDDGVEILTEPSPRS